MSEQPYRYMSSDEDSSRWVGFPFRAGDVVISTRSKSGTTWMQMICLMLAHGAPDLPAPLAELSPWMDQLVAPKEDVHALLAAQRHRRIIKTHTPLDGVPLDSRATYVVVARHPLDMAVSLYHQGSNINRERLRELSGAPEPAPPARAQLGAREWLLSWLASEVDPREELDSLPGVMWHLSDAWVRREQPNVVLVHYQDLVSDLAGQMRRIAGRLGFSVPDEVWPGLVQAATFEHMRGRAEYLLPNRDGVLKDANAFFRRGRSGGGLELLSEAEIVAYTARAQTLAPPDLLAWLHR
ncbi:MAG: sulfotransferase domain-containing protein [Micromonosporaceae bacterium]